MAQKVDMPYKYSLQADQTRVNYDRGQQELERHLSTTNKKQLQIDNLLKKLDIEKKSSNVDVSTFHEMSVVRIAIVLHFRL